MRVWPQLYKVTILVKMQSRYMSYPASIEGGFMLRLTKDLFR